MALGYLNQHARGSVVGFQSRTFILSAGRIADDRGQVNDRFDVANRPDNVLNVPAIADDQFEIRMVSDGPQRFITVQQTIQHPHAVATLQKPFYQQRSDVTCPAYNQYTVPVVCRGAASFRRNIEVPFDGRFDQTSRRETTSG